MVYKFSNVLPDLKSILPLNTQFYSGRVVWIGQARSVRVGQAVSYPTATNN